MVRFDCGELSYDTAEDLSGIACSMEQVDAEIDKIVASGIPPERIGVGGISSGGCIPALAVEYL